MLVIKRKDNRRAKLLARVLLVTAIVAYIVIVGTWWIEGNK